MHQSRATLVRIKLKELWARAHVEGRGGGKVTLPTVFFFYSYCNGPFLWMSCKQKAIKLFLVARGADEGHFLPVFHSMHMPYFQKWTKSTIDQNRYDNIPPPPFCVHLPSFLRGNRSGVVNNEFPKTLMARTRTSYDPSASSPGRVTFVELLLVVVLAQTSDPRRRHDTSNVSYSALSSLVKTGRLTNTVLKPGRVPVSTTTRPWIQSGHNVGTWVPDEGTKRSKRRLCHIS